MIEVELQTKDGHRVAVILMPQFKIWPEMLMWGERFFEAVQDGDKVLYREGYCYAVPPGFTKGHANYVGLRSVNNEEEE